MPSLTTQSIGAASASVAPNSAANQARSIEAALIAGASQAQLQQLAQSSATTARADRDRVIQRERRAEGAFADREGSEREERPDTEAPDAEAPARHGGRLNTVA